MHLHVAVCSVLLAGGLWTVLCVHCWVGGGAAERHMLTGNWHKPYVRLAWECVYDIGYRLTIGYML